MNVIDLFEYSQSSYRRKLRELFNRLDQTNISFEEGHEVRREFFLRVRGEFIRVAKLKRHTPIEDILALVKMSPETLHEIEAGLRPISDRDFQIIATYLGCAKEHDILHEKISKALTPGLREARQRMEKTLLQYGIRFADSEIK